MPDPIPHEIRSLADERSRARRARDWATADRLKDELEAAGWRVVDAGTLSSLERLPLTVLEVDGEVWYGRSEAVPSRLEERPSAAATTVLVVDEQPGLLPRSVAALRVASPDMQLVVVANQPSSEVTAEITGLGSDIEVVRLAPRLGAAAARNAGIRRAAGNVVLLLDPRVEVGSDAIGRLVAALDDPRVAVVGLRGLATVDLVHFEHAPVEAEEVVAIDGVAMAFRRGDFVARGPLDEHFTLDTYLDAWWSLVLRDVGDDAGADARPARALVVRGAYALLGPEGPAPEERLARRHRYRFLRSFATRRDLLVAMPEADAAAPATPS